MDGILIQNTLDCKGYNSMYAGENGSKTGYWWLASPSSGTLAACALCAVTALTWATTL